MRMTNEGSSWPIIASPGHIKTPITPQSERVMTDKMTDVNDILLYNFYDMYFEPNTLILT